MSPLMFDLVAKAQGKKNSSALCPNRYGRYRYKKHLKTLSELAKIAGIAGSTLCSRFQSGVYSSVEEAVDAPLRSD